MNDQERSDKIELEGTQLARQFDWNGLDILKAAEAALTDANFHHEAEIIHVMVDALENHDQPGFTLTVSVTPEEDEANAENPGEEFRCPTCGQIDNGDVTIADHGECYSCHQQRLADAAMDEDLF